ncbi:hypothetical protein P3T36_005419 [Kitasatospora sp. MAP12-15]|uniref:type VII secretion target n=1 Tax=unclassified Kitasatospora TaxID=2633591 RepID=UPI002475390E|nr:type VII secretion target [Kitasatospora sp. MAP12-44]MDH6109780.1 hypothetical protein [Kitasatospora sp. MAP12-44]
MGSASVGGGGGSPLGSTSLFQVNPADLDAAAKVAHDTGAAMPNELKTIQQPSDNAVAGLLGWQTAGSLSACTTAWEACLNALASEVDGVGDKLAKTAANYRNGDGNTADTLAVPGSGRFPLLVN